MCGWTGHIQDSEAEPLPVAETGEAELGPPSKFTSTLCRATEIWATATFGAESVRALCGVSAATANRILVALVASGLLVKIHSGKYWVYRLP